MSQCFAGRRFGTNRLDVGHAKAAPDAAILRILKSVHHLAQVIAAFGHHPGPGGVDFFNDWIGSRIHDWRSGLRFNRSKGVQMTGGG